MLSAMIVAGDKTEGIVKFFKEKNTIEVTESCERLSDSRNRILHKMINVNKLIYVIYELSDDYNLKAELEVLAQLLDSKAYFRTDEIRLFCKIESDNSHIKVFEYFKSVMERNGFSNYHLRQFRNELSYIDLYNEILGVTQAIKIKNRYDIEYLIERDSNADRVYDQEDDAIKYEPFDFKKFKQFEENKKLARESDSGRIINDTGNGISNNLEYDDLYLGGISMESILDTRNIYIVSGHEKSGVSTYANSLEVSSQIAGKRILIIDLCDNKDSLYYLKLNRVPVVVKDIRDLIINGNYQSTEELSYLFLGDKDSDFRLECLTVLMSKLQSLDIDLVFIECPKTLLSEVIDLTHLKLNRIFYIMESLKKEIQRSYNFIREIEENNRVIILLNNILVVNKDLERVLNKDIADTFGSNVKVVNPISIEDYDLDESLYYKLVGGNLWA